MFCKQCGNELQEDSKFCEVCGAQVKGTEEQVQTQTEVVQVEEQTEAVQVPKRPRKKMYGIVGAVAVAIVVAVVVTSLGIYNSRQWERFEAVSKQYEVVLEEDELGIHTEQYEELLEAAQSALLKKDKKEIKQLVGDMEEAESAMGMLRSQRQQLQSNRSDYMKALENMVVDATKQQEIEGHMLALDQAIEEVDIEQGMVVEKKLEDLIKTVGDANDKTFQEVLEALKTQDLTKAYPEEIETLDGLTAKIETLIKEGNYKEAQVCVTEAEALVQKINVIMDNLEITMTQVDTTEYPKIKVYLDIKDRLTGEVPANLEKGFFYLSEKLSSQNDYIRREIQKVLQLDEKDKLNINIVADTSGSMDGYPIESAKYIMSNFLDYVQFAIGDQVELIAFSDGVYPLIDFTNQKYTIQQQVQWLRTGNMTSLYDALFTAVNRTAIQSGAKCIIAFTDGRDNNSACTPREVIDLANRYRIPIFIIGIGDSIAEYELQDIADSTNGFYRNIRDVSDMAPIYEAIYRQQKELYVVEYETVEHTNTLEQRDIELGIQTRELGGSYAGMYTPNLVVDASHSMDGVSDIDDLVGRYLRGFVKGINSHDFVYLQDLVVKDGPLYKEVKPYIEQKDITEKLLSYEVVEKQYKDDTTCIVTVHETYEIQNQQEPLHLRVLEGQYVLKKQSNGQWQFYAFNDRIKILKKIRS